MKKRIIGFILLGLILCTSTTTAFAGTWKQNQLTGDWHYLKDDGSYVSEQWIYDNGWYYFQRGQMVSNIIMPSGGYNYYLDKSGKMLSGGFGVKDSDYLLFADKDGHLIQGPLFVNGQLYYMAGKSGVAYINYTFDNYTLYLYNEVTKKTEEIPCRYDKGKIFDRNGQPFTANSKILTKAKYIPEYDSNGNLIGEIKNATDWIVITY